MQSDEELCGECDVKLPVLLLVWERRGRDFFDVCLGGFLLDFWSYCSILPWKPCVISSWLCFQLCDVFFIRQLSFFSSPQKGMVTNSLLWARVTRILLQSL